MIMFVGDIHGSLAILESLIQDILLMNSYLSESVKAGNGRSSALKIIQVGDFGWEPSSLKGYIESPFPIYAIEGNHEYFPMLEGIMNVKEVRSNLFYVPRGTVMEIDGYKIGFMGGGESLDKAWRREGFSWWPRERVMAHDVGQFLKYNKKVDLLVTHTPPLNFIKRNFPPVNKAFWKLPEDWVDISSQNVEKLWGELGMPPVICGHMHRKIIDGQCRMLDINELLFLKPNMKPIDWRSIEEEYAIGYEDMILHM